MQRLTVHIAIGRIILMSVSPSHHSYPILPTAEGTGKPKKARQAARSESLTVPWITNESWLCGKREGATEKVLKGK